MRRNQGKQQGKKKKANQASNIVAIKIPVLLCDDFSLDEFGHTIAHPAAYIRDDLSAVQIRIVRHTVSESIRTSKPTRIKLLYQELITCIPVSGIGRP